MPDSKTGYVARMGLMFALAIALSWLESLVPVPGMPGIKLGLSNIVTLYCVTALGPVSALALAALKGLFALTRGVTSGMMSAAGGLCSVGVMLAMSKHSSRAFCSVCGAISHNAAQLAVAALLLKNAVALYYLPVLLISGVVMGLITSTLLTALEPVVRKATGKDNEQEKK